MIVSLHMRFFTRCFLEDEVVVLCIAGLSCLIIALISLLSKTLNYTFLALPVIVIIAARYFLLQESHNLNFLSSVIAILIVMGVALMLHYF